MRTQYGFRFSLSFCANSAEQQQAGEFLERIGSKKSIVIVQALTDYLQKHPGLLETGGTIHVDATAGLSKEEVRAIIREELVHGNYTPLPEVADTPGGTDQENIIDSMLDNLGLFS